MKKIVSSNLKDYTVRLQVAGESGTGFFVAPQLILTCFHVVRGAKEDNSVIKVHRGKEEYTAIIEKLPKNEVIDLALLRLQKGCHHPHVFLNAQVQEQEEFFTFGYTEDYPNGDPSDFIYIGLTGDEFPFIKFKLGQVQPGFSGSPLLNLRTGHVCGVVNKSRDIDSDLGGRAIPVNVILQFFPELRSKIVDKNPFQLSSDSIDKIFGREQEIRDIFEYLNSGSSVAIIGDSGLGKTFILRAIYHRAAHNLNFSRTPIYMSLGDVWGDDDFYLKLCEQIGIRVDATNIPKGYLFSRAIQNYKILLLLDIVESMTEEGFSKQLRRQLRDLANQPDAPLKLVVAAKRSLDKLFADGGQDSPFENICQEIHLKPWNEGVIHNFINAHLADNFIQFTEEEIQAIIQESKGYPQKLIKSCYEKYKLKSNDLGHQLPGN